MQGYKTIIVGFMSVLGGLLTALGYGIPEEVLQNLTDSLTALVGAVVAVYGVVMVALRYVTKTPVGTLSPTPEVKDAHDPTV